MYVGGVQGIGGEDIGNLLMQKNIILITAAYPYGKDEISFIEPELPYLISNGHVSILARSEAGKKVGNVPEGVPVYRIKNSRARNIFWLLQNIFSPVLYKEIIYIWRKKRNYIWKNVKDALLTLTVARRTCSYIKEISQKFPNEGELTIYTYWYDEATLAALLFKEKNKRQKIHVVSRIHGCDLYEERTSTGYQPYMCQMDRKIDRVCFISRMGMEYYRKHYGGSDTNKYRLCYLGTNKIGESSWKRARTFRIISCSHIISLKRVELLVDALAQIQTVAVEWTHFGSGEDEERVKAKAKELLSNKKNVHYCFMGHVKNEEIHKAYMTNVYDCFLSVSETEGLPVSMMEALSYGVPVIATDVGGVSEIVNGACGCLLNANPTACEIAEALEIFFGLPEQEMIRKRAEAVRMWEKNFCASKNYGRFAEQIVDWKN